MKQLKIEYVPITELKEYPNNPKKHPKAQVESIMKSMKEVGFVVPALVDKGGNIIAGHGRLLAAKGIGMKEIPCVRLEGLTEAQVKFLRLADNKLAESQYDKEMLVKELEELKLDGFDVELTGYDVEKLRDQAVMGDVPFTTELMEENNYIVFAFNNSIDWNVIKDHFGLETVQSNDSKENYRRMGVGRIVDGQFLLKIIG